MLVPRHMGHSAPFRGLGLFSEIKLHFLTSISRSDLSRLSSSGVQLCAQSLHWALVEVDGLKSEIGYQWHWGQVVSSVSWLAMIMWEQS